MLKLGFIKENEALDVEVYSLTQGFLIWEGLDV